MFCILLACMCFSQQVGILQPVMPVHCVSYRGLGMSNDAKAVFMFCAAFRNQCHSCMAPLPSQTLCQALQESPQASQLLWDAPSCLLCMPEAMCANTHWVTMQRSHTCRLNLDFAPKSAAACGAHARPRASSKTQSYDVRSNAWGVACSPGRALVLVYLAPSVVASCWLSASHGTGQWHLLVLTCLATPVMLLASPAVVLLASPLSDQPSA